MRFQTDDGLVGRLGPWLVFDDDALTGLAFEPAEAAEVVDILNAIVADVLVAAEWAVRSGEVSTPPRSVVDAAARNAVQVGGVLSAVPDPPGGSETPSPGFHQCPGSETLPVAVDSSGDRSLCSFCFQQIPIVRRDLDDGGEYRLVVHHRPDSNAWVPA